MSTDNTHRFPYGEIMVVEDNPADLKFLTDVLKNVGYQVRPASDGELALRSVQAKQPDLIMLDVNLPDMSGIEVCRHLKANTETSEIPVIFISAMGEANLKVKAFEGGGVDYVTKPFEPSEVLARIKTHVKMYLMQQKLALQSQELIAEIDDRKRIEEKLNEHRDHLEDLVEERTSELQEREERYRGLFESSLDGIAESNLEGKLLTCNPAYAKMTGYSEAELKKLKYQDLTPLKWAEIDKKHVQQCLERGFSDPYEKERLHKNGQVFPISMRIWLRKDEQGEPLSLWGIVRDITERKQVEEALRQSHTLLSSIIESPKQIIILSLDTDYRYTAFNEAHAKEMKRVWGVNIELGKRILDYIPGDEDRERAERNYERAMKGESIFLIEEYGEPENRFSYELTYNPITDEKANVVGLTLFIFDVSDNKRAEDALRESEERYRSMMEAMKDVAYICSSEFRIEYMNPRMIRKVGHNAVGESCHKAIYNSAKKCSWCVFDQIQQGEHVEYELSDPQDNHYYSVSNSPIRHSSGLISKLTICRDITENKAIESQLRQARKMESIGTMAGGIAHDFNNLLYMITGNAELALEDIPEWNPTHANLEAIKTAGLRAAGIVKQLLNFSRRTDQKLIPIGVVTIIKDALKFLRATIPATVKMRTHLPDKDITVMADPVQINQLLMNLCTNASQALEETGGILEITIENEFLTEDSAKNHPDVARGDYVKLAVSDTGPGIESEIIGRIFDPYFTTKEMGQGSGMGLAVVHGIVKNHHGTITVDSQPGKGTTFTILFPIATEKPEVETRRPDEVPLGNETILFVDDEEAIAHMTGQILERLGYKVETETSPAAALELFQSQRDNFDLVITDMTMPQMTGVKLSEKLKGIRPDIPVIICTGHSSLIDEEKAKEVGIDGYVVKPIVKSDIAIAIRNVLDKKAG